MASILDTPNISMDANAPLGADETRIAAEMEAIDKLLPKVGKGADMQQRAARCGAEILRDALSSTGEIPYASPHTSCPVDQDRNTQPYQEKIMVSISHGVEEIIKQHGLEGAYVLEAARAGAEFFMDKLVSTQRVPSIPSVFGGNTLFAVDKVIERQLDPERGSK